jgi:RNA polymerase sigma-70 factor (ECF subfamily)
VDESELSSSFPGGGEEELQEAIRLYGQKILRYCHNILCDYYEAQDAAQMTFIKAYEKRRSFTGGTSLSSWLYRIAYTTCVDITRRKKFLLFGLIYDKREENRPDFIREDLKAALLTLSPKDRALIFSRVIDERDYAELESVYHASASALRKRYERARKKLARRLNGGGACFTRLEESQ